ncbi:OLC1v1000522C1 [Oldenlandia corymbosa var. corymbosa]|uniref:OLC1v1000522C1 n=1 Tax=Oldenlandia corymbosa var. corymbosa TaxID=529605 RepID=A0AAV1D2Y3_OLDCO|nr:OLC1v1000522C1 [Oldenlandia corymbosa var. corymbosa]
MSKLAKLYKHNETWADLPEDLLEKILNLTCLEGRFRSTAVCKGWHSGIRRFGSRLTSSYSGGTGEPWIFSYSWEKNWDEIHKKQKLKLVTKLVDPSIGNSYSMENPNWEYSETNFAFGAKPIALKNGWILFAKKFQLKTFFFLYHIFSQSCIWLPTLGSYFELATFSKSPVSTNDCLVFASYKSGSQICIGTCKIGDASWNTMIVCNAAQHYRDYKMLSVVYYGEDDKKGFYCVFRDGIFAKFGVSDRSWSLISVSRNGLEHPMFHQLVQYERELMLVVKNHLKRFHIFRFDWSVKKWIPVSGINNKNGATIEEFNGLFSKNQGNGALLSMNLNNNPYEFLTDPPTFV